MAILTHLQCILAHADVIEDLPIMDDHMCIDSQGALGVQACHVSESPSHLLSSMLDSQWHCSFVH